MGASTSIPETKPEKNKEISKDDIKKPKKEGEGGEENKKNEL